MEMKLKEKKNQTFYIHGKVTYTKKKFGEVEVNLRHRIIYKTRQQRGEEPVLKR